jgi:hypothetical protein
MDVALLDQVVVDIEVRPRDRDRREIGGRHSLGRGAIRAPDGEREEDN